MLPVRMFHHADNLRYFRIRHSNVSAGTIVAESLRVYEIPEIFDTQETCRDWRNRIQHTLGTAGLRYSTTPVGTGVISGTIVGAEGERVRKAAVHLMWNGTPRSAAVAISDGSGRFRFESLPPGRYELRATKEGFGSATYGAVKGSLAGKQIDLKDAEALDTIVLRLMRPGTISGVVTDRDRQPLVGAEIPVYKEVIHAVRGS